MKKSKAEYEGKWQGKRVWISLDKLSKKGHLGNKELKLGLVNVNSRRRQWQPTPVLLPGNSHGRRSLVGCSPWGRWVRHDSDFTFTFHFQALEKEMATHSSVLAWSIPGMVEHRVGHDWSSLAVSRVYVYVNINIWSFLSYFFCAAVL